MNLLFPVAVVICFFLCWSPYHAQRLLFSYLTLTGRWNGVLVKVHHYLYWSSGIKGVILIGCQLLGVNGVKKYLNFDVLFSTTGLGYYLSCCVNPVVYCAMSKQGHKLDGNLDFAL